MDAAAGTIQKRTMMLTEREQAICRKYSKRDAEGRVHCNECPLSLGNPAIYDFTCYANIDGRTERARELKRL